MTYSIRSMRSLNAAQNLELGQWLISNEAVLKKHPRKTLASMASESLGYPISESSVALQSSIRGIVSGHPYTKRGLKGTVPSDSLAAIVHDLVSFLGRTYVDMPPELVRIAKDLRSIKK